MLDYQPQGGRRTSAREDRRLRPERHNPSSIATLRIVVARQLLGQLLAVIRKRRFLDVGRESRDGLPPQTQSRDTYADVAVEKEVLGELRNPPSA